MGRGYPISMLQLLPTPAIPLPASVCISNVATNDLIIDEQQTSTTTGLILSSEEF